MEKENLKSKLIDLFYKSFETMSYKTSLKALNNYSKIDSLPEEIIDFVFGAFIEPNLKEIKNNIYKNSSLIDTSIDMGNITYYILPTSYNFV